MCSSPPIWSVFSSPPIWSQCSSPPIWSVCSSPPIWSVCSSPPIWSVCSSPPIWSVCSSPPIWSVCSSPPIWSVCSSPPIWSVCSSPPIWSVCSSPPIWSVCVLPSNMECVFHPLQYGVCVFIPPIWSLCSSPLIWSQCSSPSNVESVESLFIPFHLTLLSSKYSQCVCLQPFSRVSTLLDYHKAYGLSPPSLLSLIDLVEKHCILLPKAEAKSYSQDGSSPTAVRRQSSASRVIGEQKWSAKTFHDLKGILTDVIEVLHNHLALLEDNSEWGLEQIREALV